MPKYSTVPCSCEDREMQTNDNGTVTCSKCGDVWGYTLHYEPDYKAIAMRLLGMMETLMGIPETVATADAVENLRPEIEKLRAMLTEPKIGLP